MKIAISGLNNTDNPSPGIPVAKSLKDEFKLIGLSYDATEPGNYQKIFSKVYLIPYPSYGFNELETKLKDIKKRENIDIIIPNLDAEIPLYIKYQDKIKGEIGIDFCLPSQQNFDLRNKKNLIHLATELGIKYPRTYEVNSILELRDRLKTLRFPIIVKGNYYKAYKSFNVESAIDAFIEISNEWGLPILVQENIDGEEVNLVGVANKESELKGAIAIKKLTTTNLGKVWMGLTIRNAKLMQIAHDFVKRVEWKGAFELECIIDSKNNIYIIEINPRFPSWVYFATELNINLPKMLVDIIQDKEFPTNTNYPANKMYVRFVDEMVVDFNEYTNLFLNKKA